MEKKHVEKNGAHEVLRLTGGGTVKEDPWSNKVGLDISPLNRWETQ